MCVDKYKYSFIFFYNVIHIIENQIKGAFFLILDDLVNTLCSKCLHKINFIIKIKIRISKNNNYVNSHY